MVFIISGHQGSGKSTLAKALINELYDQGYVPHLVKFADALYEMHDAVLAVLKKFGVERNIVKDGPLLQLLGTEWGRKNLGEDVWCKIAVQKVQSILDASRRDSVYFACTAAIVIDDARFENELDAFPNAYKIRLECPTEVRRARCSMWRENDAHPSETGLDNYAEGREEFDCYINTEEVDSTSFAPSIVADAKAKK